MEPKAVAAAFLLVAASLVAGCSRDGEGPDATGTGTEFRRPPPREVLSEDGNNAQCSELLTDQERFDFQVHEGYDTIEVMFHASGLGTVGYEIAAADGSVVASAADYNPGSQPCTHDHTTAAEPFKAGPGSYTATVRNNGILGWILVVNEVSTATGPATATPA